MSARLAGLAHAWLVALDQLAYVTLAGPVYLLGRGPLPNPHETISSCVGRNAVVGRAWALRVEPVIDRLFELLGSLPGHCRRSIVRADLTVTPTP